MSTFIRRRSPRNLKADDPDELARQRERDILAEHTENRKRHFKHVMATRAAAASVQAEGAEPSKTSDSSAPSFVSVRSSEQKPLPKLIEEQFPEEYYTAGAKRPSFTPVTDAAVYGGAESEVVEVGSRTKTYYKCRTKYGFVYLPRESDRRGREAYCHIGHKVQWQNYCASRMTPVTFEIIDNNGKTVHCAAYPKDKVKEHFNDQRNLELQSSSYNTSIAKNYVEEDYPLAPQRVHD